MLDAHCAAEGGIMPSDPDALREWLLRLANRAFWCGRRTTRARCYVPVEDTGRKVAV
jgi:hypothetical protein